MTITRKKWLYNNNKIFATDNKEVVPKGELFQVLSHAHSRIAHRGRQITTKWLRENYAEVNQKIVNVFVQMCKYNAEQAPSFLSLSKMDLMDFRKCPCQCTESHTWAMNVTDHHTKHVTLYPLTSKSGEKVLQALQEYCYTYGYPKKIVYDNGKEFCNKQMDTFCKNNGITITHGAPRTPQTQGLIERSNRSCKEDMQTFIVSTAGKDVSNWCKYLGEVSYT